MAQTPRVAFLTSAIDEGDADHSSFDYFASLTALVVDKLQDTHEIAINVPSGKLEASVEKQRRLLIQISNNATGFSSGVIIASQDPASLVVYVRQLLERQIPVFTIDMPMVVTGAGSGSAQVISVFPNNYGGGVLAADALWEYYESFGLPHDHRPSFIVLEATGASAERSKGFADQIERRSQRPGLVAKTDVKYFTREAGRDWAEAFVDLGPSGWGKVYGIFACNDEIALGVRSVFVERFGDSHPDARFAIVGFDCIRDFRVHLDSPDERWLLATVRIPLEEMASSLYNVISASAVQSPIPPPPPVECSLKRRVSVQWRGLGTRDNTYSRHGRTPQPARTLALFVHGFGADEVDFWGSTVSMLNEHADVRRAGVVVKPWQYRSSKGAEHKATAGLVRLLGLGQPRLLSLPQIAESLRSYATIALRDAQAQRIVLFGHSFGGLVVAGAVAQWLDPQQRNCPKIAGVATCASPMAGAKTAEILHRIYDAVWLSNVQLEDLLVSSPNRRVVMEQFRTRFLEKHPPETWQVFKADSDEVLDRNQDELWAPELVVRDPWDRAVISLTGLHSGCVQNLNDADFNFKHIVSWLLARSDATVRQA